MNNSKKTFVVIDFNSLLVRAANSTNVYIKRKGKGDYKFYESEDEINELAETVARQMNRILSTFTNFDLIICHELVRERSKRKWRFLLYPDYKKKRNAYSKTFMHFEGIWEAGRIALDNILKDNEKLNEPRNIRVYGHPELEGDELIAKLAFDLNPEDAMTIVSGDRDFIQLIRENVFLLSPVNKVIYSSLSENETYEVLSAFTSNVSAEDKLRKANTTNVDDWFGDTIVLVKNKLSSISDPMTILIDNVKHNGYNVEGNVDSEKSLFVKVVSGDKSDYIHSVTSDIFGASNSKNIGPKRAEALSYVLENDLSDVDKVVNVITSSLGISEDHLEYKSIIKDKIIINKKLIDLKYCMDLPIVKNALESIDCKLY